MVGVHEQSLRSGFSRLEGGDADAGGDVDVVDPPDGDRSFTSLKWSKSMNITLVG